MGIIEELISGRDGMVRAVKFRAGHLYLERALQQLYPLEWACDWEKRRSENEFNPDADEFTPEWTKQRAPQETALQL